MGEYSQGINLDEVVGGSERVPAGRYDVRPVAVTPKDSRGGKPMIVIDYEIVGGDHDGDSLRQYFTMYIGLPKKPGQKFFAPGISELKALLAAAGSPWPANTNFPTKENSNGDVEGDALAAVKIFGPLLRNKVLQAVNREEPSTKKDDSGNRVPDLDDQGNQRTNTRLKVIGLAERKAQAGASGGSLGL